MVAARAEPEGVVARALEESGTRACDLDGVAAIESHANTYGWNVWILLNQLGWPTPDSLVVTVVNLFVTIDVLVAVGFLCRRGVGAAVLAGALATLAALLTAQWTSPSYFALVLAPLAAIPALMTRADGAVGAVEADA